TNRPAKRRRDPNRRAKSHVSIGIGTPFERSGPVYRSASDSARCEPAHLLVSPARYRKFRFPQQRSAAGGVGANGWRVAGGMSAFDRAPWRHIEEIFWRRGTRLLDRGIT